MLRVVRSASGSPTLLSSPRTLRPAIGRCRDRGFGSCALGEGLRWKPAVMARCLEPSYRVGRDYGLPLGHPLSHITSRVPCLLCSFMIHVDLQSGKGTSVGKMANSTPSATRWRPLTTSRGHSIDLSPDPASLKVTRYPDRDGIAVLGRPAGGQRRGFVASARTLGGNHAVGRNA